MEQELISFISDQGLGVMSFAVLIYALVKGSAFFKELLSNHLHSMQESMEKINDKLEKIISILEQK